jgi:hypothetical protein
MFVVEQIVIVETHVSIRWHGIGLQPSWDEEDLEDAEKGLLSSSEVEIPLYYHFGR